MADKPAGKQRTNWRKTDKPPKGAKPFNSRFSNDKARNASGGNRIAMTFSCPIPKVSEIDARWIALKLKGRSEYLAALVAADLAAAKEGRTLIDM
ncbi:MAG: hypothetical protein H7338_24140 [Candidatus Sericytochromatia bacterium]|nr:hypothetical protein [Candidatus Sericytochromatia bacterium]